jgi:hypothetical protein
MSKNPLNALAIHISKSYQNRFVVKVGYMGSSSKVVAVVSKEGGYEKRESEMGPIAPQRKDSADWTAFLS